MKSDSTGVAVSWDPASDDTGVTGYEIDSDDLVVAAVDGKTTTTTVIGLAPGTTYHLVVRARDAAVNLSPPSVAVSVTVAGSTDLSGHWTFDDGSGTTAHDSSGANNAGAIANGSFVAGRIGGALQFDGATTTVSVGNAQLLNLDRDSFTVALWFRARRRLGCAF